MEKKSVSTFKNGEGFDWRQLWKGKNPSIILGAAGLVLVSAGILSFLIFQQREPGIEILPIEAVEPGSTIFIDLEGAVLKPGLYELPSGSRVNDLLIRAGGLAAEADRIWVEKNLNLAQKLEDGVKVYIPGLNETQSAQGGPPGLGEAGQIAGSSANIASKININTASASQLDSLWGIGQARAANIIEGRPYSSLEELLERKIIPGNVYERIKEEIVVY